MRFTIEFDKETDGQIIAEIRELPGCMVYGATRAEADASVRALALRILADQVEHGECDVRDMSTLRFERAA